MHIDDRDNQGLTIRSLPPPMYFEKTHKTGSGSGNCTQRALSAQAYETRDFGFQSIPHGSAGRICTDDLEVMSLVSCSLLHRAWSWVRDSNPRDPSYKERAEPLSQPSITRHVIFILNHFKEYYKFAVCAVSGSHGWARTSDKVINSHLLIPTELRANLDRCSLRSNVIKSSNFQRAIKSTKYIISSQRTFVQK